MTAISPIHTDRDFPGGMTLDNRIDVFAAQVNGWQLDPAQYLLDTHPHGAFAVMHIAMSYFESIAKMRDGFQNSGSSKVYFVEGFNWVFANELAMYPANLSEYLYERARNGLYHRAMTEPGIVLTANIPQCFHVDGDTLAVNPHLLVPKLREHFGSYVRNLKDTDPNYDTLRANFQSRSGWIIKQERFAVKKLGK